MPKAKRKAVFKGKAAMTGKSAAKDKATASSESTPKRLSKSEMVARSKVDPELKITVEIPKTSRQPPFFFWTDPDSEGGFLSPWFTCPFEFDGTKYVSAGQYIMACRAEIYRDQLCMLGIYYWHDFITKWSQESLDKRLATRSDDEIKTLADNIKDSPTSEWIKRMFPS